jgi:hypothetical protein
MQQGGRRKRHHYIPQGYLKLWADSMGQVQVRRRDAARSFRASTLNVAVEADLHTIQTEAGHSGHITCWFSGLATPKSACSSPQSA